MGGPAVLANFFESYEAGNAWRMWGGDLAKHTIFEALVAIDAANPQDAVSLPLQTTFALADLDCAFSDDENGSNVTIDDARR